MIYARRCSVRDENILRAGGAGKQGGHPVATAQSTKRLPRRRRGPDGDVEYFGPEPLAGVDAANVAG